MKRVDLDHNILNDESSAILSACLHNIEKLKLSFCQLTTRGIKKIFKAISQLSAPASRVFIGVPADIKYRRTSQYDFITHFNWD